MAGICFVFGCSILNQARAADSTNALLVKLRSPGQSLQHFAASPGHKIRRRFDQFGWVEVALPPESSSATALANYRARPEVLAVEPDVESPAVTDLPQPTFAPASSPSNLPDDPLFPKQWSLARIGAPLAWLNQTGDSNVVVAVLDSGVNYLHEDLQINLWRNPGEIPDNGIDDDGNGWVDDVFGIDTADAAQNDSDPFDRGLNGYYHGSLIAGIIGATSQNHLGIAGMNWSVRIMAVRTIRGNNTITTSDELEALNYVLMMKRRGVNIRAVNMSYGGLSFSVAERDALAALADSGILLCASAGNSGTDNDITPNYPSSYPLPGIIAVAASDELDHLAAFPFSGSSQYGRTSVDLAAPGLHVISTFGPAPDSYESEFFGTSAATPHVTAAVALLAAANPAATSQEIKAALVESVDVLPAFTNKMVSNGRLNLARAIDHPFIARGPATIARSPTNQSVVLSNRVTFDAIVFGAKPRNVQWSHNDQILTGATNENLILSNVSFDLAGDYALVVSNSLASATSTVARLTVLPLQITNQPHEIAVRSGGTARLSVSVLSPVPVTYQWFFGSQILNGATNQTLNIPKVKLTNDGDYHVIVANRFGTGTSEVARLTVLINPGITVAPISQGVVQGGSATFSVALSGNPLPFGVQWLQGTAAKSSNTVAAFQDFFVISNAQPAHAGTWRVRVRNSASSSPVERTFTLRILADADGDGVPDAWERLYGMQTNDVTDAALDFDSDGLVNRDEYLAGTQPTNAQSRLALNLVASSNGVVTLRFDAISNRTYTVEAQSWPGDGKWSRVADVLALSTNRTVEVRQAILEGDGIREYRVRTPRAPE